MAAVGPMVFGFVLIAIGLAVITDYRHFASTMYERHKQFWGKDATPRIIYKSGAVASFIVGCLFIVGSIYTLVK